MTPTNVIIISICIIIVSSVVIVKVNKTKNITGIEDCMFTHIKPESNSNHYRIIRAYCMKVNND